MSLVSVDVDWPVAWLISSHHRKYAFCSRTSASSSEVLDALVDFERRILWSWFYRSCTSRPPLQVPGCPALPYRGDAPQPALHCWSMELRLVVEAFASGQSSRGRDAL